MQCQKRFQIFPVKNIGNVFELSGLAFRLPSLYGDIYGELLVNCVTNFSVTHRPSFSSDQVENLHTHATRQLTTFLPFL